jgi:hypothetical protein
VNDLAIITAILYAGRLQRRLPETEAQKLSTMQESCADARLILAAVDESSTGMLEARIKAELPEAKAKAKAVTSRPPNGPPVIFDAANRRKSQDSQ